MNSEDLTFEDILKHIDRESEHFVIRRETHHHSGREVTVVEPHRPTKDESWLRELARQLKETLFLSQFNMTVSEVFTCWSRSRNRILGGRGLTRSSRKQHSRPDSG